MAVGTALGLGLAVGVTRFIRAFPHQVSPTDPLILVTVPAVLAAVAGLASWLPARGAARVDPIVVLRAE